MNIDAKKLRELLTGRDEVALLDVREEAAFGSGHILLAVNLPLSRLELRAPALVPRRSTRVVTCDGRGEGLAQRGAECLGGYGYSQVSTLAGGVERWREAGFEVFSGINVPSKLFGEFVEHEYGTPSIAASELKRRIDDEENLIVLDSRPLAEYRVMSIPGSRCVPGGELVYRVRALAPDPATVVVVNCAGRTRSIIGAQSLINAGIENPVLALRNGTMGWHLAGLALEHDQHRYLPEVSSDDARIARERAAQVCRRFGARRVDAATVSEWVDDPQRSLFVLDVRSPEEYARGHLHGARSAPGGQLIQATDRYVGTLRARIVLVDDDGVRAPMAASWLAQMGLHDVYVLADAPSSLALPSLPDPLGLGNLSAPTLSPAELAEGLARGDVAVLDLSLSLEFKAGHIPGARHAVRGALEPAVRRLPAHALLVLTSGDGLLARYAAAEARALSAVSTRVLEGGNRSWSAAGRELEQGARGLEENPIDTFLRPYDRARGVARAMESYLEWEIDLFRRMERDGTVRFARG